MNIATEQGRVTADVELKTTTSGKSVAEFTLAVNRDYKNANGEYDADFIRCVAYDKTAEILSKYVNKGDRLLVSGPIYNNDFTDNAGIKHYGFKLKVDKMDLIGDKKKAAEETAPHLEEITDDEDLPF